MTVFKRKTLLVVLYGVLGFLNQFILFTIKKDMKHYGLALSQIGLALIVPYLPWSFKFVFGMISDNYPIFGQRRRPYLVVSNIMAAIFTATLTIRTLSLDSYIVYLFFVQFFSCFADVCIDSSMVEETKTESHDNKGNFQTTMMFFRILGRTLAAGLGPIIWERLSDGAVFTIEASLFLFQALVGYLIVEPIHEENGEIRVSTFSFSKQERGNYCGLIIKTFSDSIFYKMIIFNIITGLLPSAGLAMFFFLTDELHYSPDTMGLLDFLGNLSQLVGVIFFKYGFKTFKIRNLYLRLTVLSVMISILPIVITIPGGGVDCPQPLNSTIVSNVNTTCYLHEELGVDSLPFAFSDDVFGSVIEELKSMPLLTLTGILCKASIEGVAYSLSLGIQNWVQTVQVPINSALMHAMDIDHGNFRNLPLLLVLCSSLELCTILFIRFLPNKSISEISVEYEERNSTDIPRLDSNNELKLTSVLPKELIII